jgi:hypothetical protein
MSAFDPCEAGQRDAGEAARATKDARQWSLRARAAVEYLTQLLAADLSHLSPEERGDALARALAAGLASSYRGADCHHAARRLRQLADWLDGRAELPPGERREPSSGAIPVPSPEAVPGAIAALRARRAA